MGLVALAIALRSIVLLGLTDSGLRRGGKRRGSRGLSVFGHYDCFRKDTDIFQRRSEEASDAGSWTGLNVRLGEPSVR